MLFLYSLELGLPTTLPAGECVPPPFGSGGRGTLAWVWGGGGPNSDEGTDSDCGTGTVFQIYVYFVIQIIHPPIT
jgi:hypothetical protein